MCVASRGAYCRASIRSVSIFAICAKYRSCCIGKGSGRTERLLLYRGKERGCIQGSGGRRRRTYTYRGLSAVVFVVHDLLYSFASSYYVYRWKITTHISWQYFIKSNENYRRYESLYSSSLCLVSSFFTNTISSNVITNVKLLPLVIDISFGILQSNVSA